MPTAISMIVCENNHVQHKMVHLDRSVGCCGCTRTFTTYAGMIIHLESGTCGSGIDILDLNESAAMCYQWRHYIDEEYRDYMLERRNLDLEAYSFRCPTCETVFSKLSGLFQHIGSRACGQRLREGAVGKLVRWLENRHS